MHKKMLSSRLIAVICFMAVYFAPLFPQDSYTSEAETWTRISNYLDCLLFDPIANLALIERVEDLNYWTSIYSMLNNKSYLKELFSKKFLLSDIDEIKIDAIFRLLKAYSSTTSYERLRPIISRIVEISSIKPEWFARSLLLREDRREIARLIVKADIEYIFGARKGIKDIMADLQDHDVNREMTNLFNDLDYAAHKEIERFKEFMKDPAGNLDRIKDIYDLCAIMGPVVEDDSFDILVEWIIKDTDETKMRVLFHIMNHCDGAYHLEVTHSIAEDVFTNHMAIFISALKDEPNWRRIIFPISYGLYDRDKDFKKTISTLGNSGLEAKVKSQLDFLSKHIDYENSKGSSGVSAD